jgi:hypothetical protein
MTDDALPDRRAFLMRSAATLAAAPILATEACSHPAADPAAQLATFVALSSVLLGIDAAKLGLDAGPSGVAAEIFARAQTYDAALLAQLLQTYTDNALKPAGTLARMVLEDSGADAGFLAKAIMLGWLLGSWYDPAHLATAASGDGAAPAGTVISANAYRQSWAWKIAQTKPMGTTTAGFGSWAAPPQALDATIGSAP